MIEGSKKPSPPQRNKAGWRNEDMRHEDINISKINQKGRDIWRSMNLTKGAKEVGQKGQSATVVSLATCTALPFL